jgi:hypothetical protein
MGGDEWEARIGLKEGGAATHAFRYIEKKY